MEWWAENVRPWLSDAAAFATVSVFASGIVIYVIHKKWPGAMWAAINAILTNRNTHYAVAGLLIFAAILFCGAVLQDRYAIAQLLQLETTVKVGDAVGGKVEAANEKDEAGAGVHTALKPVGDWEWHCKKMLTSNGQLASHAGFPFEQWGDMTVRENNRRYTCPECKAVGLLHRTDSGEHYLAEEMTELEAEKR